MTTNYQLSTINYFRTMKHTLICLIAFFTVTNGTAQTKKLKSGPWAGNVELRTATIWMEVSPDVKNIKVNYFRMPGKTFAGNVVYATTLGKDFAPVKLELTGLDIHTNYTYEIELDGKKEVLPFTTSFTTKDLWQYRKPAPDFNFLTGSCAYFNEPRFDRPGRAYGSDSTIFTTMAKTPATFNLWLGDSWYTREVDYSTVWGMNYRVSLDRSREILQPFLASMPQYHIWEDHDYGPNNAGKSFIFKEESRRIFINYTANPSYGMDGKGIYTKISYSDVDIFLTDNRYFRSEQTFPDSIDGKPNPAKSYFGAEQMDWLKNALLASRATFKIIATGGQILNPASSFDCMRFYSFEYNDLLNFLQQAKISGVLFLSGDRHHSEVIKLERAGNYPLYDVTVSPFTAGISRVRENEENNPARVPGTLVQLHNFGNISISGEPKKRKLRVSFIGLKGEQIASWEVDESELKAPLP